MENDECASILQISIKVCPKDNFPLPRIDTLVDQAARSEMLSFLDCFSSYHQIWMRKEDEEFTSFITPFGIYCFVRMAEGFAMPAQHLLE